MHNDNDACIYFSNIKTSKAIQNNSHCCIYKTRSSRCSFYIPTIYPAYFSSSTKVPSRMDFVVLLLVWNLKYSCWLCHWGLQGLHQQNSIL